MKGQKETIKVEKSEPKRYRVVGFGYLRARKYIDGRGEVVFGKEWIQYSTGELAYFKLALKKIERIIFDDSTRTLRVYFEKGGLKIIPYSPEMEIDYVEEA